MALWNPFYFVVFTLGASGCSLGGAMMGSGEGGEGRGRLVAWLGREYFGGSLTAFGWRLCLHSYHEPRLFTWEDILALCGGEVPDALVLGDRSHPPPFLGLERYPCLTLFHSVDSHIHAWHPLYAQAFDACSVSLKDHLPRFTQGRLGPQQVLWSPAYAPNPEYLPQLPVGFAAPLSGGRADAEEFPLFGVHPGERTGQMAQPATTASAESAQPEYDLLFVGTVDPETTPQRHAFLARLAALMPNLTVLTGYFAELFPKGRLLLNVAERGDLNFRVFEALAMGKCLLTPAMGHGLLELFQDGVDLMTYQSDDAKDAAEKARWLLAHPAIMERLARSGYAKVDAGHRAMHRARDFSRFLAAQLDQGPAPRLAAADTIRDTILRPLHLHWAEASQDPVLRQGYLRSAARKCPPSAHGRSS